MTMKKSKRLLFLFPLALGLSACGSVPTRYLTLSAVSRPVTAESVAPARQGTPIWVAHVQMPPDLDRLYLTTAIGANRIRVSDSVRWVAPLGSMTQRVLAEDMSRLLPHRWVLMPGDPLPKGHILAIRVVVRRFLPSPDQRVVLDLDWFMTDPRVSRVLGHGRVHLEEPSTQSPAAQAAAMSRVLGRLAAILARRSKSISVHD